MSIKRRFSLLLKKLIWTYHDQYVLYIGYARSRSTFYCIFKKPSTLNYFTEYVLKRIFAYKWARVFAREHFTSNGHSIIAFYCTLLQKVSWLKQQQNEHNCFDNVFKTTKAYSTATDTRSMYQTHTHTFYPDWLF